jgi:hypothetical protein
MSRVTTKPTLWVCAQHGSRPACASAQSDQDPYCSLTYSISSRETDSEQHGARMHRLVWIHAGHKRIMLDLLWRGSNCIKVYKQWDTFTLQVTDTVYWIDMPWLITATSFPCRVIRIFVFVFFLRFCIF